MFNLWISKKAPHTFLIPSDLQSHYQALIENGQSMNDWAEVSWRDGRPLSVRDIPGEYHPETGRQLGAYLKTVILEQWPTREEFKKLIAKEAEVIFPKLEGESLYQAGIIFPPNPALLRKHLPRLKGKFRDMAEQTWQLEDIDEAA
jgi:hypothetical protein